MNIPNQFTLNVQHKSCLTHKSSVPNEANQQSYFRILNRLHIRAADLKFICIMHCTRWYKTKKREPKSVFYGSSQIAYISQPILEVIPSRLQCTFKLYRIFRLSFLAVSEYILHDSSTAEATNKENFTIHVCLCECDWNPVPMYWNLEIG